MSVIVVVEQELHDIITSTLIKHHRRMGDHWNWDYAVAESDFVDVADEVCEAAKAAEKAVKNDQ